MLVGKIINSYTNASQVQIKILVAICYLKREIQPDPHVVDWVDVFILFSHIQYVFIRLHLLIKPKLLSLS